MSLITFTPSSGRHAAAMAAVVAVVARLASIVLWPPDADASHAKMLRTADVHHAAWTAATATEVIAWVTAGAAVLAATTLATGRGRWLVRIAGWWAGASAIVLGLVGGAMNSVTGVIAQEPNPALMVRIQDDLHSPVLDAFVAIIMIGDLMLIAFAVGMVRARLARWWFPVLATLAVVGYLGTSDYSNHLVVLLGFLPLAATWLLLARLLGGAGSPVPISRPLATAA